MTTRYIVGFLFRDEREVLLIEKARPAWQVGRLNGVGGHVEPDEVAYDAMVREFEEETGWAVSTWEHFATLIGDDSDAGRLAAGGTAFEVVFFASYMPGTPAWSFVLNRAVKVDEPVQWYPVNDLPARVLPNLRWLVPLAFHAHRYDWPLLVGERGVVRESPAR